MDNSKDINQLIHLLARARNVSFLTGAGISAESEIPTFRGEGGLWKQFKAEELATMTAFQSDPKLVWEWYDWRRELIAKKSPNPGHLVIAKWEKLFPDFTLVTQNIDGLHQKAGSRGIVELHGNIWKMRCTAEGTVTDQHESPLKRIPPLCAACGALLRPHVVWFGESLDMKVLEEASTACSNCEVLFVVGTSAVVQPAASLPLAAAHAGATLVEINPQTTPLSDFVDYSFRGKAGEILPILDRRLEQYFAETED